MKVSQVFAWMVLSLTLTTLCTAQISDRRLAFVDLTTDAVEVSAALPAHTEFRELDTEAVPFNYESVRDEIKYPEVARGAAIEGMVQVQILVNEKGLPIRYRIGRSPHTLLSDAVAGNIGKMRFYPATIEGKPCASWVTIPFTFRLQP